MGVWLGKWRVPTSPVGWAESPRLLICQKIGSTPPLWVSGSPLSWYQYSFLPWGSSGPLLGLVALSGGFSLSLSISGSRGRSPMVVALALVASSSWCMMMMIPPPPLVYVASSCVCWLPPPPPPRVIVLLVETSKL